MTTVPAAMRAGARVANPAALDPMEEFRRDRHALPAVSSVPMTQTHHLTPSNAASLQYPFRPGAEAAAATTPLIYRVVPPGHDAEVALQGFHGSQLFGQSNAVAAHSSPGQEGHDRFPFQYSATAAVNHSANSDSNDSTPSSAKASSSAPTAKVVAAMGGGEPELLVSVPAAAAGQFYVMMAPQDVFQGQRALSVRPSMPVVAKAEPLARSSRDERRRATHNEVERRRRDKINNWIVTLSKLVPDCLVESQTGKNGLPQALNAQSKGGILAKTVEYIGELKMTNASLGEQLKENQNGCHDLGQLKQQLEELKAENSILRNTLAQHGIERILSE